MTDEFSILLRFVALQTADLDRSREFYEGLLGLQVCGEKPGEFVQFAVGDAAVCVDRADGEEPPAAIFAVRGLEQLCQRLADAGVSVARSSEEGVGDYVVVHDPDGHELVFEPAEA
jgi:catechol 2,3-dioxygenase-like lactoylglutathione lyase family enzyme